MPAYNEYTARAQASEANVLIDGHKTPITEAIANRGFATGCSDTYLGSQTSGKYVASMAVTGTTSPDCGITATFKTNDVSSLLSAKTVVWTFESDTGVWTCSEGTGLTVDVCP